MDIDRFKLINVALTYRCNRNCDYCYTQGLSDEYVDMTKEDYIQLIDWFSKHGVTDFNVIGGEPTQHPLINEFLRLGREKGFRIGILSNGVFEESLFEALGENNSFLINFNPPEYYTPQELRILRKNLGILKEKKIGFSLGFNVGESTRAPDYIIEAIKTFSPREAKMDLLVPNSFGCNIHVDKSQVLLRMDRLGELKKQVGALGVSAKSTRAMPHCWPGTDRESFYSTCGSACGSVLINPDLTIFPCVSVFYRGPKITTLTDPVTQINEFYSKPIEGLRWDRDLYDECHTCVWKLRRKCQGACLTHKSPPFGIRRKEGYSLFSEIGEPETDRFARQLENVIVKTASVKKPKFYLLSSREEMMAFSGVRDCPPGQHLVMANRVFYCDKHDISEKELAEGLAKLWM